MRVTTDNWKEVWRDMKESGVLDATHAADGTLRTVTTKNGNQYEFSPQVIKQLMATGAMEVKLGRKVDRK